MLERKMRRKIKRLKTYPVYKVIEILKSVGIPHYKYILPCTHEDNILQESLNQWKGFDVAPNQRVRIIKRKKLYTVNDVISRRIEWGSQLIPHPKSMIRINPEEG
jgi:hypothetical protein